MIVDSKRVLMASISAKNLEGEAVGGCECGLGILNVSFKSDLGNCSKRSLIGTDLFDQFRFTICRFRKR